MAASTVYAIVPPKACDSADPSTHNVKPPSSSRGTKSNRVRIEAAEWVRVHATPHWALRVQATPQACGKLQCCVSINGVM